MDQETYWRVDSELLTYVEVLRESLWEDTPINVWIPVMHGSGQYMYVETRQEAGGMLYDILEQKIQELKALQYELLK